MLEKDLEKVKRKLKRRTTDIHNFFLDLCLFYLFYTLFIYILSYVLHLNIIKLSL